MQQILFFISLLTLFVRGDFAHATNVQSILKNQQTLTTQNQLHHEANSFWTVDEDNFESVEEMHADQIPAKVFHPNDFFSFSVTQTPAVIRSQHKIPASYLVANRKTSPIYILHRVLRI